MVTAFLMDPDGEIVGETDMEPMCGEECVHCGRCAVCSPACLDGHAIEVCRSEEQHRTGAGRRECP
jgi:Na+-translocating ferredoxin:NAD+ oxidoreductase RnfC subunit